MLQELILVLTHTEEIRFFLEFVRRAPAVRTAPIQELSFGPEGFTWGAVPVLVFAQVDVSGFQKLFKKVANAFFMTLLGCANKVGVGYVQLFPQGLVAFNDAVGQFKWGFSLGLGGFFDFLPVFIGTCQERNIIPLRSFVTCQHIAGYGCVGVTDVRHVVHVINGSRYIKALAHCLSPEGVFWGGRCFGRLFLLGRLRALWSPSLAGFASRCTGFCPRRLGVGFPGFS